MNTQHSNFITDTRTSVTKLLEALEELSALQVKSTALGLGTMDDGTRLDTDDDETRYGDFAGTNKLLTSTNIGQALNVATAIQATLSSANRSKALYTLTR